MSGRVFVDTNVLVYAHDAGAGHKREVAARVLEGLWRERRGLLSMQVLEELYVTLTRKVKKPLSRARAREIVRVYSEWEIVPLEASEILNASEIEERHRLSFWDAMIVATASTGGAERLLTEDLSHGQSIEGVRVENPFTQEG
jgi:predicted nucleic acid-binding protein